MCLKRQKPPLHLPHPCYAWAEIPHMSSSSAHEIVLQNTEKATCRELDGRPDGALLASAYRGRYYPPQPLWIHSRDTGTKTIWWTCNCSMACESGSTGARQQRYCRELKTGNCRNKTTTGSVWRWRPCWPEATDPDAPVVWYDSPSGFTPLGSRQVVRQGPLKPPFHGSNPCSPTKTPSSCRKN